MRYYSDNIRIKNVFDEIFFCSFSIQTYNWSLLEDADFPRQAYLGFSVVKLFS